MTDEAALLAEAAAGNAEAFAQLVAPHRARLRIHCYRMLGSFADAEDAVQEALLGAWQGLGGFEGRSALGTWLFVIATRTSLRVAERRRPRVLAMEVGPASDPGAELPAMTSEIPWLEPLPGHVIDPAELTASPEARYAELESVELAFVAALQHLPASQRAVVVLRDVLGMSAEETATALETSVASANSALQRARSGLEARQLGDSQLVTRRALGEARHRAIVERFLAAWSRADVDGIVALLAEDAVFTMPPIPTWFAGREAIRRFFADRVFALRWHFVATTANGQPAIAAYPWNEERGRHELSVINVLGLRGTEVASIHSFLDPAVCERFDLPPVWTSGARV